MKMRAPSVPLITVDPYFSVWSPADRLYEAETEHWTGSPNTINGYVTVDGKTYRFMGDNRDIPSAEQISCDVSALVTDYTFKCGGILLNVSFYTPLFPDDVYRLSRPVSYMTASYIPLTAAEHTVSIKVEASEELCINKRGEKPVEAEKSAFGELEYIKIGSAEQALLNAQGDDIRIDWGYFCLNAPENAGYAVTENDGMTFITAEYALAADSAATLLFAYDDIKCLDYFGTQVEAYWKSVTPEIGAAMAEARSEQAEILAKCRKISSELFVEAQNAGGEKYAELLSLAYRQLIAAHKVALDENGEIIFISKECFSNGCAATVDVTYPSSPFFLLYNRELLKGMLRPIFKFAAGDVWKYDFAPHDVGTYPWVTGQRYGWRSATEEEYRTKQMPVEECGNMLIMMANIAFLDGNTEFFDKYADTLAQWVNYLIEFGSDPDNQLCTDDFAGHLAHNCNLSLKAIMGIMGYALVLEMKGDESGAMLKEVAREMAQSWVERAANKDGSFRLAFDRENTFSMKYNVVWDKLWGTGLFAPCVIYSEFASNKKHINTFGMPLDNRKNYTKSDWLVWTACLAPDKAEFEEFIAPLWSAYDVSPSRVPMTDWYDTKNSAMVGFRHRSVQGGLFIKLLEGKFNI